MKIIKATHLGMCFGVRDAINLTTRLAETRAVTVLGELVHNPAVLRELRDDGVEFENELADVRTSMVVITAHGASDSRVRAAREQHPAVVEATCPLVHHAHRELNALVAQGGYPVVIGRAGHVEVRGLTEDLAECSVVLSAQDIERLPHRAMYGVVAQTTQPIDRVHGLVALMRSRLKGAEIRFRDTVCRPTKDRQSAAVQLARECDVVIVVGGSNSNNTGELANTCRRFCTRVHRIESPDELAAHWFEPNDVVGLTAGTSTPDSVIADVEARLNEIARIRENCSTNNLQPC